MADSQRKTANLFDGTYTKEFIGTTYIYKNTGTNANCAIIPCEPSTTYSVKKYDNSNRFAIGTSNVLPYDEIQLTGVYYLDTATSYTFTTDSSAHYMVVYVSTGTEQAEPRLMVNEGSTALPYEPYGWLHSLRKLTTATDTLTTLPADVYADGTNATVGLKGQMVQTGTPTPSSPIQPSETGERTGNLFSSVWETGGINANTGENIPSTTAVRTQDYIPITPNQIYSFARSITGSYIVLRLYDSNKGYISGSTAETTELIAGYTVTQPMGGNTSFCCFKIIDSRVAYIRIVDNTNDVNTNYMMVNGEYTAQTMPAYEPYGYKIPISSASTTTPVYLGEVETTRKIRKYICTGDETVDKIDNNIYYLSGALINSAPILGASAICTHYENNPVTSGISANLLNGQFTINQVGSGNYSITIHDDINGDNVSAQYKQYLAQQYANGTPVTVWYVLATETTGIVNEPLRKIGNYADTVSGITIPTITGKDTVDVETTLKPSEVSLSYTGWHDASVKEWDGSQWNE